MKNFRLVGVAAIAAGLAVSGCGQGQVRTINLANYAPGEAGKLAHPKLCPTRIPKDRKAVCGAIIDPRVLFKTKGEPKKTALDLGGVKEIIKLSEAFFAEEYRAKEIKALEPVPPGADAATTQRIAAANAPIRKANAKKMEDYFADVFPVADFLYLLGKGHMNSISRTLESSDARVVEASAEDLTISEKLFAAAARVDHAGALFELATFYSSPAGTMESHNTAINLFYKAGLAFLKPPRNLAKASEATEGIIRLKTGHLLARVLNCKIVEPPDSTDCAKLLVQTPVGSRGPEAQPAAEPPKLESPPLVSTTLFGVLNTRETAQSAYVVRRESYFSFGTSGGTDRERGLLRVLGPNYLPNYTIGFDFTMQLSLALTTNYFNLQPEVVGLRGQPFSLANDLSVPATVFTVTEADFRFFQLTLYYYPHRFVYLGIANLSGELEANGRDSANVEQVEKFPVSDNLMVLGFTYDIFNPNYGRSRDPLAFKKNTGTWVVNLEFAVPFKSDTSIVESIASFGIGYRFF